jgi:hypothetical protein
MYIQQRDFRPDGMDREETALLERFPATTAKERDRLRNISSWSEVMDVDAPSPPPGAATARRPLRQEIAALVPLPYRLVALAAAIAITIGSLVQAARRPW